MSDITFGPGNTAVESDLGQAGLFNGIGANTFAVGDGTYAVDFSRYNSQDWVAFENNGQFLSAEGGFSARVENTGVFNGGQGEVIAAMDANTENEGDWILRFERDTSTTGQILLRYQRLGETFFLRSTTGAIAIGDIVDVSFEFGAGGVGLFVDGMLEDSSTETADFTQNINSLILGSSNWTATPGSFPASATSIGSSLTLYNASFIPTPGAAGLLAMAGLATTRRRRR